MLVICGFVVLWGSKLVMGTMGQTLADLPWLAVGWTYLVVAEIVATLVANGPAAVKACKQLVRDVAGQELTEALRAETARRIADIRASSQGKEGVQSFLGKRSPNWQA
jgi:hypothetical protein